MAKRLIISAKALLDKKYKFLSFEGPFKTLFGNPPQNFRMLISGDDKQGKSTFSLHFYKYLTDEEFGKAVYVSYEQKHKPTMQLAVQRVYGESEPKEGKTFFGQSMPFEKLVDFIKKNHYKYVFIDSIQWAKFTQAQYQQLDELFPNKALIFVSYKKYPKFFAHAVDIKVYVEEGVAYSEGRTSESEVFQIPKVYESFQKAKLKKNKNNSGQLSLL